MNREEGGGNKDQEKGKDGTKSRSKMWRAILRKKKKRNNSQQINEDREQLDIWYIVYIRACVCVCFNRVCQTYS